MTETDEKKEEAVPSLNEEIAEQEASIFEDVPLEEKLNEGFGAFYENLLKQREYSIDAAA